MPTFCRHNRFIERCPICSKDAARERARGGHAATRRKRRAARAPVRLGREGGRPHGTPRRPCRGGRVLLLARAGPARVRRRSAPGGRAVLLERASRALAVEPPGVYEQALDAAAGRRPRPRKLDRLRARVPLARPRTSTRSPGLRPYSRPRPNRTRSRPSLQACWTTSRAGRAARTSPAAGTRTLVAYAQWAERSGGQTAAFTGSGEWSPERRFARLFERLSLPGFHRGARYELLVSLGRLGVYELRAESLHLGTARGAAGRRGRGGARRQARVRDRRSAAARPSRDGAGQGRRGPARSARPCALQLVAPTRRRARDARVPAGEPARSRVAGCRPCSLIRPRRRSRRAGWRSPRAR